MCPLLIVSLITERGGARRGGLYFTPSSGQCDRYSNNNIFFLNLAFSCTSKQTWSYICVQLVLCLNEFEIKTELEVCLLDNWCTMGSSGHCCSTLWKVLKTLIRWKLLPLPFLLDDYFLFYHKNCLCLFGVSQGDCFGPTRQSSSENIKI